MINKKQHLLKYIYTFSLLCLCMVFHTGCASKEDSPSMPSIFFIPQAEGGDTRADLIDSAEDINHFLVWGNYDGNVVFNGIQVSKEGNEWVYEPLQYWNMNATQYEFYAYTTAQEGTTATMTNNQLSVSGIDSKNNPADLVMAYTPVTYENFRKVVNMNFKHALAMVHFSFKLKEGFNYTHTYRVTSVKWNNVYTQGQFTIDRNNTITSQPSGSLGETLAITTFTGSSFTTQSAMVSDDLLVNPQSSTTAQLVFTLEVNGKAETVTKTVSIDWKPGTKYSYNVVIDPYEITVVTTPWEKPNIQDIEF